MEDKNRELNAEELEQGVGGARGDGGYYGDGKLRAIPMESLMREVQYAKRDGKDMESTIEQLLAPYDTNKFIDFYTQQLRNYWLSDESSRILSRM